MVEYLALMAAFSCFTSFVAVTEADGCWRRAFDLAQLEDKATTYSDVVE